LKENWLTKEYLHSKITKTSQKDHDFLTNRGIGKSEALIRRRMMKVGKLLALSYFMGMTVALLAVALF
jgi:hypothetical protein